MGISVRHYLFPENSSPLRLTERVVNGLVHGQDLLPRYEDSRQRVLAVYINTENGQLIDIYKTEGAIWTFDDDGDITEGLRKSLAIVMESAFQTPESNQQKVVSLDRRRKKKDFIEEFRWTATPADLDIVSRDIWPKSKTDRLKLAEGTSKKKPALTWDAKRALQECGENFGKIPHTISNLKEPSLKAFIHEALARAKTDPDFGPLYRALSEMAQLELDIVRRRRTNKGVWYAVVDIMRWRDHTGETVASFHECCKSRTDAEKAARRLLAEHASKFNFDTTVEATIVTDLEWLRESKCKD